MAERILRLAPAARPPRPAAVTARLGGHATGSTSRPGCPGPAARDRPRSHGRPSAPGMSGAKCERGGQQIVAQAARPLHGRHGDGGALTRAQQHHERQHQRVRVAPTHGGIQARAAPPMASRPTACVRGVGPARGQGDVNRQVATVGVLGSLLAHTPARSDPSAEAVSGRLLPPRFGQLLPQVPPTATSRAFGAPVWNRLGGVGTGPAPRDWMPLLRGYAGGRRFLACRLGSASGGTPTVRYQRGRLHSDRSAHASATSLTTTRSTAYMRGRGHGTQSTARGGSKALLSDLLTLHSRVAE